MDRLGNITELLVQCRVVLYVCAITYDIVVEFIPSGKRSNARAWKFTKRMEVESCEDESKYPYYYNHAEILKGLW